MSQTAPESFNIIKLQYPIGKFTKPETITTEQLNAYIEEIEVFPARIAKEVAELREDQLDTPYRPEGWTIRQVVHHCADSHINSYTRFKLALTEEDPIIRPYFEERWAELTDALKRPAEDSLLILRGLHNRWVFLLLSLTEQDLEKGFIHPEHGRKLILKEVIGQYAWHCNHHLAHITELKKRKEWE